jgi:hypothetical protein
MAMLILDTRTRFEQWLSENDWFEDARVLSLKPFPNPERRLIPLTVNMEIAYQIEGNYKAYSTRISRVFQLIATGIQEYQLSTGDTFSSEHWSNGIEILESDSPIAFQMDIPGTLTLCCEMLAVEQLPDLVETVRPWLSDRDVAAKIPASAMPSPEEWIRLFKKHNLNVAWHIYGSESKPTSEVPPSDYEGWFLQVPEELCDEHQGLFFFGCKPDSVGFSVNIHNHNASTLLWHTAEVIIGQFQDVEVHCGNCEFHGSEWLEQLSKSNDVQQDTPPDVAEPPPLPNY